MRLDRDPDGKYEHAADSARAARADGGSHEHAVDGPRATRDDDGNHEHNADGAHATRDDDGNHEHAADSEPGAREPATEDSKRVVAARDDDGNHDADSKRVVAARDDDGNHDADSEHDARESASEDGKREFATGDDGYEPTSPWWLSGTPLEAEHHRLMRRRATPIPWHATTAGELTQAERKRLAGTWMRRSEAEYLAVSTFSVLAIDLVAAMAPADVISLCLRAGIDEVRHAELCVRMAQIYSGEQNLPVPGMSSLPDDPARPKLHQALANTMLVSCVSETYATTVLSATRDLTTDPTAQAVLTAIYSDEVMHARLGWSYLRHAIEVGGQGVIDAAAEMLPRALRGVANVVERERPVGEVTEAVRAHGLMTPAEERVIYSTCVREVLVPGFQALGIPVGSALEDYGDAWAHAA